MVVARPSGPLATQDLKTLSRCAASATTGTNEGCQLAEGIPFWCPRPGTTTKISWPEACARVAPALATGRPTLMVPDNSPGTACGRATPVPGSGEGRFTPPPSRRKRQKRIVGGGNQKLWNGVRSGREKKVRSSTVRWPVLGRGIATPTPSSGEAIDNFGGDSPHRKVRVLHADATSRVHGRRILCTRSSNS